MLRDISGRAIVSGHDGWRSVTLIPASNAHHVPALAEIAVRVERGLMPGDTPIIHATKEVGGGYPDVLVGVPLTVEELRAWQHGDRSVARDVVEALEQAFDEFLEQVKADRVE